jgi:hypothetical protein
VEYVKQEAKIVYLLECLQKTPPPVLIFAEKKQDVDAIHEYLLLKGVEAVAIHGGKGTGLIETPPILNYHIGVVCKAVSVRIHSCLIITSNHRPHPSTLRMIFYGSPHLSETQDFALVKKLR